MKKEIYRIHMMKENGKYKETYRTEDPETVYKDLAQIVIAKKIDCCTWVKRIKKTCNYDGTYTYEVLQDNGHKDIIRVDF